MNKQQERYVFEKVNGKLWQTKHYVHDDSPDFLLEGGSAGVEITEVVKAYSTDPQTYSMEAEICRLAAERLNGLSKNFLHGTIQFRRPVRVRKVDIGRIVEHIVATVLNHSKHLLQHEKSEDHHIASNLPTEIEWISYDNYPFWGECTLAPIRQKIREYLNPADLIATIQRKEVKIPQYMLKCKRCILIIAEGFLPGSWIGKLESEPPRFETAFDEVILFHFDDSQVVRLK